MYRDLGISPHREPLCVCVIQNKTTISQYNSLLTCSQVLLSQTLNFLEIKFANIFLVLIKRGLPKKLVKVTEVNYEIILRVKHSYTDPEDEATLIPKMPQTIYPVTTSNLTSCSLNASR